MNILKCLPLQLCQKILWNLSPKDIYEFWNCSQSTRNLMNDDYFWHVKCKKDNFHLTEKISGSQSYKNICKRFGFWQGLYFYMLYLNYNWKNYNFRMIAVDKSIFKINKIYHVNHDIFCIITEADQLYLLNSKTGKKEALVDFKFEKPTTIAVFKDLLIYVERYHLVKIWNLTTRSLVSSTPVPKMIQKIYAYKNRIGLLCYSLNLFILNTNDKTLINVHARVHDVHFHENFLILRHHFHQVKILNLEDSSSEDIICCETEFIINIYLKNKYLISMCVCEHLLIWNVETGSKQFKFPNLYSGRYKICFFGQNVGILYSTDTTIAEVWNLETKTQLFEIDNQGNIDIILTNNRFIFTFFKTLEAVKIWCALTGKCVILLDLRWICSKYKTSFFPLVTDTQLFAIKKSRYGDVHFILDYEKKFKTAS